MKKIIVSLSGGMDSATVLGMAISNPKMEVVGAIGFMYGSKHSTYEVDMAEKLCYHYGLNYEIISLGQIGRKLKSNLLQSGGPIPEGHYEDKTMKLTVVPGRNLMFAAILAAIAETRGADEVHLGIHSGDHAIYPDCRPEFLVGLNHALKASTEGRVRAEAPVLNLDKQRILEIGYDIGVPYHYTRTCYKAQRLSCGKCGSCQERLEAFAAIGKKDPVKYEKSEEEKEGKL